MIDSLSPLFTDRNTRLAAFPDEQRLAFQALEKSSGDPMFADRQLASIWMSKRTGLTQAEVLKNFDGLASRYFGEGSTATQAYDRISELYKAKSESAPAQGKEGEPQSAESPYSVSGTVIAKDIAGSLPGGAARMGYTTLGGFYANLAAATGVTLKRPQDDPEYQALDRRRVLANDPTAFDFRDEEMGFGVAADEAAMEADGTAMQVIRDRVQAENMAALEAASGTFMKSYSDDARKIADTMYGLSKASLGAFGVREEFQDTAVGELLANAGSLPVTALMAAMGPIIGPGLTFSSIYGDVEQERMQVEGKNYDPTGAWLQNLASAGPQAAMEYAFGVERAMAKIVKMSPRVGGKIMFGDAARLMGKTGLAGGIEEGLTEPTQGHWNDWLASLTYDEKRELFTEEKLKERLLESASAFFLGFFFSGGLQGVQIMDRNKAVSKSERFLLTREGKPIDGPDFAALRTVKTDEELRAMAPNGLGDMLVGAANGNVGMQIAYRQETLRQAFVDTDGMTVQGLTIGKIGDEVGLRNEAGQILVIDQNDPQQVSFLKELQAEAVARDATTQATIDEMKRRFNNLLEVEKRELPVKLSELRKKGLITREQEADALAAAVYINEALSEDDTDPLVMGSAKLTQSETDNILRMVINVAQGADPTVAVEELAEAWKKKGIVEGKLDELKLRAYREQWHKDNNESDPAADGRVTPERADTEWFSKRVVDYALANRKIELPGGWGDWLRTLGERLRKLLQGATRMKKMLREGKISPELEGWFREALGAGQGSQSNAATFSLSGTDNQNLGDTTFNISAVSPEYDASRIGTAVQGTKAKPKPTTKDNNVDIRNVTAANLKKQMEMMVDFSREKKGGKVYPFPKYITSITDPNKRRDALILFMKDNLVSLYKAFPAEYRDRATLWYDGARKIADGMSAVTGQTPEQSAAIMAAFSPLKDWFQNVQMALNFADIFQNNLDDKITPENQPRGYQSVIGAASGTTAAIKKQEQKDRAKLLEAINGRSIRELWDAGDPVSRELAGWAVRIASEHKHGLDYDVLAPEGTAIRVKTKKDGEPQKMVLQSPDAIVKALSVSFDGRVENISNQMGKEHKVRNFYNNIIAPNSPYGDATMDTHAINANLLFPMGGSSYQASLNFGKAGVAGGGNGGTYWLHLEALRQAAAEVGIQPRQMQSITWEAIRSLFPDTSKRDPAFIDKYGQIWATSKNADEARKQILADGIEPPEWATGGSDTGVGARASNLRKTSRTEAQSSGALRPTVRRGSEAGTSGSGVGQSFNLASTEPAPVFYSRLIRTVEQSTQGKANGAQWKATIKNSKLGVNQDEFALVGVQDLEDGKTYTKQEVLDYLKANEIKVQDVTLGNGDFVFKKNFATEEELKNYISGDSEIVYPNGKLKPQLTIVQTEDGGWNIRDAKGGTTQFERPDLQLPGAIKGSYREVLLTVPKISQDRVVYIGEDKSAAYLAGRKTGEPFVVSGPSFDGSDKNYTVTVSSKNTGWQDGHGQYAGISNPVVRLRTNERTTSDGKRMLFLEEVQAPQKLEFKKMPELFQKNWREIGFKWALRKAVEGGFDVLGWTTGQQQADRYNLSKQVSGVRVEMDSLGGYGVKIQRPGDRGFVGVASGLDASQLEEHIGKDLAKKAVEDLSSRETPILDMERRLAELASVNGAIPGTPAYWKAIDDNPEASALRERIHAGKGKSDNLTAEYTGLDLNVGGEGLIKLYDSDFRNVVNGLAPVKKSGQKVSRSDIITSKAAMMESPINGDDTPVLMPEQTKTVNSLEITDAIASMVVGGQPTFSLAQVGKTERIQIKRLEQRIDAMYSTGRTNGVEDLEAQLEMLQERVATDMEAMQEGDTNTESAPSAEEELISAWFRWNGIGLPDNSQDLKSEYKTFGEFVRATTGDTQYNISPNTTDAEIEAAAKEAADQYDRRRNALRKQPSNLSNYRAVPADASNVVEMPDGARLVGPTTFSIKAFHGTPHKVSKFSMDKIGTGEGAQAYGWGLYFAQLQDVAMQYQPRNDKQEATMMAEYKKAEARQDYEALEVWESAMLHKLPAEIEAIYTEAGGYSPEMVQKAKTIAKKVASILSKSGGALYTVELLPNEDEFLDYDALVSDQSDKVKAALATMDIGSDTENLTGGELYRRAQDRLGGFNEKTGADMPDRQRMASEAFVRAGIPGIQYLDSGSRSVGNGTRNYVIFDENLVQILEENGKPVKNESATTGQQTFALTPGTPASRKFAAIYAKQAAMFPYPYHRISSTPTQTRVSLGGHEAGLMGRMLLPVSERLRFIADRAGSRTGILYRARRYYSEKGTNLKRYSDQVIPLMRGLAKMSTQDMKIFKAAASNQDALQRNNVISKYGLQSEWAAYEAARDSLRAEMIAAGIDVGDIGEYFPRWVKDVTGLRESFGMAASDEPLVQAVIDAEKKAGRTLTDEEVNAVLDGAIRGVRSNVTGGAKPANTKERKIVTIADTQLDFYADPNHALSRWLNQSTEAIARYRFFGKDGQPSTVFPSQIDLDVSIGSILREEVASGNLAATAQMEVKAMLDGLFGYHGKTNGYIRGFMDISYWATMGKLSSSLAQAVDVMVSVYEAGPWNAAMAVSESMFRNAKNLPGIGNSKTMSEAVAKFTKGKNWLTREDLGVDRIMDEFNNQSFTTTALNQVFTATGLNFMDGIGKDTLLNAKFQQLAKQAKRSAGLSASNQKMIEQIFGKAKARQVIADFRAGNKNADTIFTVYNVLADWQPISLLEYPEVYAKNPNGRVLYMLKSYSIKMLAAYRREGFMKMWYGSPEQKIEGARNLAYLLAMLFMAGVSKDWLVDFLLDRDPQLEDVVVDNVFKLAQVSRYALWQQRNRAADMGVYGGVDAAARMGQNTRQILTDMIAPPSVLIERPAKDLGAWAKAKANYEPWSFWASESVQFIPIAGEIIYWTGPTGQAKIERRRKLRDQ